MFVVLAIPYDVIVRLQKTYSFKRNKHGIDTICRINNSIPAL